MFDGYKISICPINSAQYTMPKYNISQSPFPRHEYLSHGENFT